MCLAKLTQLVRLFSTQLLRNSTKEQLSMVWQFSSINCFSSEGLELVTSDLVSSDLSTQPLRRSARQLESSWSQELAKKSSKSKRLAGSQTSILRMSYWKWWSTSKGKRSGFWQDQMISVRLCLSLVKKGWQPNSIWYVMIPKLHMSHFQLYFLVAKTSGAMVIGDPTQEVRNSFCSRNFAKPKSANLTSKFSVTRMFCSLRSRWTMRCFLMAQNAPLSWMSMRLTCSQGSLPWQWSLMNWLRSFFLQCSKTRYRLWLVCLKSTNQIIFLCFITLKASSSWWMRSKLFSGKFQRLICLTAQSLLQQTASNTVEQEPLPIGRRRMYGPTFRHFLLSVTFSISITIISNCLLSQDYFGQPTPTHPSHSHPQMLSRPWDVNILLLHRNMRYNTIFSNNTQTPLATIHKHNCLQCGIWCIQRVQEALVSILLQRLSTHKPNITQIWHFHLNKSVPFLKSIVDPSLWQISSFSSIPKSFIKENRHRKQSQTDIQILLTILYWQKSIVSDLLQSLITSPAVESICCLHNIKGRLMISFIALLCTNEQPDNKLQFITPAQTPILIPYQHQCIPHKQGWF